jgi:hypothetical protein
MKLGDQICWQGDLSGRELDIHTGTITNLSKDWCWIDGNHKSEDGFSLFFIWPIAAKDELEKILLERRRLLTAYDDSMKLIYELRNRVVRGEIS